MTSTETNVGLINSNDQLRLMNRLLERRINNLQNENTGLRNRLNALITNDNKERLRLLLADRERRRLTKLKAIVKKHVSILTSGVREFTTFVQDIDDGIAELAKEGALDPEVNNGLITTRPPRITAEFNTHLQRIAESPLVRNSGLDASANPILVENNEKEIGTAIQTKDDNKITAQTKDDNNKPEIEEIKITASKKQALPRQSRAQTPIVHTKASTVPDEANGQKSAALDLEFDDLDTNLRRLSRNFVKRSSDDDEPRAIYAGTSVKREAMVSSTDSLVCDFEDGLNYTMIANEQNMSALNPERNTSLANINDMRPLQTSTPKVATTTRPNVDAKAEKKSKKKKPTKDGDGFVPPRSPVSTLPKNGGSASTSPPSNTGGYAPANSPVNTGEMARASSPLHSDQDAVVYLHDPVGPDDGGFVATDSSVGNYCGARAPSNSFSSAVSSDNGLLSQSYLTEKNKVLNKNEGSSYIMLDPQTTVNVTSRQRNRNCSVSSNNSVQVESPSNAEDSAVESTMVKPESSSNRKRNSHDSDEENDRTIFKMPASTKRRRKETKKLAARKDNTSSSCSSVQFEQPTMRMSTVENSRLRRKAATKTSSYKWPKLNTKLRRE